MTSQKLSALTHSVEFTVPFYDLDAIQMVWHGNYVKYMEDAREAFGAKYGFEYLFIFNNGFLAPVVDMHLKYKESARMGDILRITIEYMPARAAKMCFKYIINRVSDNALILEAETTQLFVSRQGEFFPTGPDFYDTWKSEHGF